MKKITIILFITIISINTYSQTTSKLTPKTTAISSAIIPGLGQIINKKYYKPPIIYAGLGISIYYLNRNNKLFQDYKEAYLFRSNNIIIDDNFPQYTDSQLLTLTEYYNRNRDISILTTCAIYIINIIDAYIDGHLINFDVNKNLELSLNSHPQSVIEKNHYNYISIYLKF